MTAQAQEENLTPENKNQENLQERGSDNLSQHNTHDEIAESQQSTLSEGDLEVDDNLLAYQYQVLVSDDICSKGFDWFSKSLQEYICKVTESIFTKKIEVKLVAITKNPHYYWKEYDFFVIQMQIARNLNAQIRLSDCLVGNLLKASLGNALEEVNDYNFKMLSELEATIITYYAQKVLKGLPQDLFIEKRRIKYRVHEIVGMTHLLFFINIEEQDIQSPLILSIPTSVLAYPKLPKSEKEVNLIAFYRSYSYANILVGMAKVPLKDLREMYKDDVIVLEESKLTEMTIKFGDHSIKFKVKPSESLIMNLNNGESIMDNDMTVLSQNIWDGLMVDVTAEFQEIKLPLGELRKMTEGLVVEIAPIVNNKITLHIDNKPLAKGELIIVGDKYGVKIVEVFYHEDAEDLYDDSLQQNEGHFGGMGQEDYMDDLGGEFDEGMDSDFGENYGNYQEEGEYDTVGEYDDYENYGEYDELGLEDEFN